jgi:catechol 2,3-dioxygenase
LEQSLVFYQEIIGFKILNQTGKKVTLTADEKTPILTIEELETSEVKTKRTTGLYHFAILLPTREELSIFLRHIIEVGYPLGAADHYVSEALYMNDPDGNGIEVYCDRPSTDWNWSNGLVDMATVELDADSLLSQSNGSWNGLPSGTTMGHIHLHVSDLKKSEEFYTKGLGLIIVSYYPQAVFLSTGGYHHHIAINTWNGTDAIKASVNNPGLHFYTLVYPTQSKIDEAINKIQQLGYSVFHIGEDIFTEDPSGNRISLKVYSL